MISNEEIGNYYAENFDMFVKRYSRRCGSEMEAEDCIQNAFERALKYKASCREGNLPEWFSGILRNAYLDFLSAKRQDGMAKDIDDCYCELPPVVEDHNHFSTRDRVYEAIEEYPEHQKEILTYHFKHGFNCNEISQIVPTSRSGCFWIVDSFKKEMIKRYS